MSSPGSECRLPAPFAHGQAGRPTSAEAAAGALQRNMGPRVPLAHTPFLSVLFAPCDFKASLSTRLCPGDAWCPQLDGSVTGPLRKAGITGWPSPGIWGGVLGLGGRPLVLSRDACRPQPLLTPADRRGSRELGRRWWGEVGGNVHLALHTQLRVRASG